MFYEPGDDRPYVIEKLLPANDVSLIFGAPGVGKTRYIFELCHYLLEGKPLIMKGRTFQVTKVGIGYASYDRSAAAAKELLKLFGLIDKIQWHSFRNVNSPDPNLPEPVPLHQLIHKFTDCQLIIVDGIGMLMSDPNKYSVVSRFMRYAGTICEKGNFAMLGNLHSGKERTDSKIINPRLKSLGSTAFAGVTECQLYMSQPNQQDPEDPNRMAHWMPHTGKAVTQGLVFTNEGRLVNADIIEEQDKYLILLAQVPYDKGLSRDEILDLAFNLGISRYSCDAWLKKSVSDSLLTKPEYGKYSRRKCN